MSVFLVSELETVDPVPKITDELLNNALDNALLLSGVTTGVFTELSEVEVVSDDTGTEEMGLDCELVLVRSESLGKSVGTVSVAQAEGVLNDVE